MSSKSGNLGESHTNVFFFLHGMVEKKMTAIQVKNSFKSLPNEVKDALGITEENFVRDDILVTASNTGYHAKKLFVHLFYTHCQDIFILN